jgi:hypothetical protein
MIGVSISKLIGVLSSLQKALKDADDLGRVVSSRGPGADYAPYVQSAERQTSTHKRTGWHTDETAVREFEKKADAIFNKAIGDLGDGDADKQIKKAARELLEEVLAYMQDYPTSQSMYARTNSLHDSWEIDV